jgi:hypothetical protein
MSIRSPPYFERENMGERSGVDVRMRMGEALSSVRTGRDNRIFRSHQEV